MFSTGIGATYCPNRWQPHFSGFVCKLPKIRPLSSSGWGQEGPNQDFALN